MFMILFHKQEYLIVKVESKTVEIPKTADLTSEYIENELTKLHINPLRWAITNVSDKIYTVSVANLQE